MTTPLIRLDTTINTNVKGSKVFGLAFVNVAGVTDAFTEAEIRAFVLPKLSDPALTGSVIVQLDNVSSGENYHSGRGDESFTGLVTKVFSNGITDDSVTTNGTDVAAGIDVYFLTMDGINETAVRMKGAPPLTLPIYGYRDFKKRFDPTVTFDNAGDKLYTAVTNYELTNPATDLLTMSTHSELVIEASDSYEIASTERMLLNPVIKVPTLLSYNFSEMYPNPTLTSMTNIHATFTNGTLNGYYKTENSYTTTTNWWHSIWTDNTNHFHTQNGVYTNFIDIDFGTTCLIDQIKYFANSSTAPQECYVFASDTEINGNVTWPNSADYFANVDTNGIITVNGIIPTVMSEQLSKTKKDLNNSTRIAFYGATDVPMSAQYIPWLNNELGRVFVGRYVRMYIQQKHAKRYDSSYTGLNYVGGILIQCFGKPTIPGATMTYNLSKARSYITQYYDMDVNTTTRFLVNDLTVANQPLPTQFYSYSWTTNASSTSLIQHKKTPVNAQVLLNPIVTYSQGTSNSIVIDTSQSSYMTDTVFENWFPYRLYPTDTTFTHDPKGTFVWPDDNSTLGEAYTFTNSTNGLSGYYKFSNTYDNKWSSRIFTANNYSHYHSQNGYNKIIIDIDLGAICNVSKMTYYSSTHLNTAPTCQQMAIYVSENEIHGTAGWPIVDSEEPYIGTTTNGVTPIVLKPIEGTYNTTGIYQPYILSDNNILKYQTSTDSYVQDRPLMEHETDFGTGRYVRVYMRRMKSPLQYVGGTLLAFFGSQL
jgi:hypothetical protein